MLDGVIDAWMVILLFILSFKVGSEDLSQKCRDAGSWWFTLITLATWETEIRWIMVQGQSGQIVCEMPISNITIAKWTEGVAQVVECLLCKYKALSSNSSSIKKKKKKNRKSAEKLYEIWPPWATSCLEEELGFLLGRSRDSGCRRLCLIIRCVF
jgi:Zn ribbon nucleic-acid-binding protein